MKKSTKAALLSGLVFPGVGHIYLKKYILGAVLAGVSFTGTYYVTSKTVERILQIIDKIQSFDAQLTGSSITELVSNQSSGSEDLLLNIATAAFIICWLIGIISSYRVGCALDEKDKM